MSVEYADGALRLTPVEEVPNLDDLVSRINTDNVHGEVDFGSAVGKEAW